ncbi:MAG: TMEM175 family protein [Candidatus Nanopelagicales bacterium]|jgi:uncharacterized membrane protein|nr:TMEM175 family protein [Candidatus Nanopelagicales bacterium]MCU0298109.1 TMEM175 family protein [Candidatus Nanopelagicales bacterium]
MSSPERYGPDRIIAFSDAVVAIAITVLLLPLADVEIPDGATLGDLIRENGLLLGGLTLSWLIIALFWLAHHRLFDRITYFDALTVRLNFLWLFAIALMPVPTNVLIESGPDRETVVFYVGWMLLITCVMLLIGIRARHVPGMIDADYLATPQATEARYRSYLITGVFAICFVIALIAPNIALYFLLLQIPVDWAAGRLAGRSG